MGLCGLNLWEVFTLEMEGGGRKLEGRKGKRREGREGGKKTHSQTAALKIKVSVFHSDSLTLYLDSW